MRSLITTAPDELRAQLRGLSIPQLVRITAGFRPAARTDVTNANRLALKTLARRVRELDDEIETLDESLTPLVAETAPEMIERVGVGTDTAGALLVAAGENTSRIRNERPLLDCVELRHSTPRAANNNDTDSAAAATVKPTVRSGAS